MDMWIRMLSFVIGLGGLWLNNVASAFAYTDDNIFEDNEIFYGVSFTTLSGKKYDLRGKENKPVVLFFFHYKDFASLVNLVQLDLLQEEVGDEVAIVPMEVFLASDEDKREFKKAMKLLKLKHLKVFVDNKATSAYYLNIKSIPTTIIFDIYGKVVIRAEGMYDWESNSVRQIFWRGKPFQKKLKD